MLIGSNGEKQGLVAFAVALESARVASLDLVQVSPSDAEPVVCKLLDYGNLEATLQDLRSRVLSAEQRADTSRDDELRTSQQRGRAIHGREQTELTERSVAAELARQRERVRAVDGHVPRLQSELRDRQYSEKEQKRQFQDEEQRETTGERATQTKRGEEVIEGR